MNHCSTLVSVLSMFRKSNLTIPISSAASKRCRKSKSKGIRAPCVHLSSLVEARTTQLWVAWVASFHSDQRLRLPRCCRTSSSISGMSVSVVGW